MRTMSLALRHELVGLSGVIERNIYLVKRYIWWDVAFFLWTVANTLTIVFIAKGIPAVGGKIDVSRVTTAAQGVRRGRDLRQRLHPAREHRDRVVDAGDDEQHALRDEPELRPLLGRDQRQDRGHHPDPDERD